jgi:Flp pilus assembly pilin Flp
MKSNETIENTETTLLVSEAKRKRQKGVTTVEYAVMLFLIAIAVMIANPGLSGAVVGVFNNMATRLAIGG